MRTPKLAGAGAGRDACSLCTCSKRVKLSILNNSTLLPVSVSLHYPAGGQGQTNKQTCCQRAEVGQTGISSANKQTEEREIVEHNIVSLFIRSAHAVWRFLCGSVVSRQTAACRTRRASVGNVQKLIDSLLNTLPDSLET